MIEWIILAVIAASLVLGVLVDFASALFSRFIDLMFALPVLLGVWWLYRTNRKLRAELKALKGR